MNNILLQPIAATGTGPVGRLLIVEPDGQRAVLLGRILRPLTSIDLRIVPRVTDAIRAITETIPDLVMTTPLLPPAEESDLLTQIRRTAGTSHVQVINLPHAIETVRSADTTRTSVFQFLRRSTPVERDACDSSILREQIQQYLAGAVARREEVNSRVPEPAGNFASSAVVAPNTAEMILYGTKDVEDQRDRRRASRRMAGDLPGLW